MAVVYCDKCKKEFDINIQETKTEVYFRCSYCNEYYLIHYKDDKVVQLQNELAWVRKELERNKDTRNITQARHLTKKYENIRKQLKRYLNMLKLEREYSS